MNVTEKAKQWKRAARFKLQAARKRKSYELRAASWKKVPACLPAGNQHPAPSNQQTVEAEQQNIVYLFLVAVKQDIMKSLIVTPKNKKAGEFLKKLLSQLNDVKSVKEVDEKTETPFVRLSESSLEKEWSSEEDNIWDIWAQQKLKNNSK
jgi:hypothetical protein